jgi:hypothetical protein
LLRAHLNARAKRVVLNNMLEALSVASTGLIQDPKQAINQ